MARVHFSALVLSLFLLSAPASLLEAAGLKRMSVAPTPSGPMAAVPAAPSVPPPPYYFPLAVKTYAFSQDGWVNVVQEGFEAGLGPGWEAFDADGPIGGEYFWARRQCQSYSGGWSAWAVGGGSNGAPLACGSDYPADAGSWLIYGPISLAGATAAEMRLQLWLNTEFADDFCYMASPDNLDFYGYCVSWPVGDWTPISLDLANLPRLGSLLGDSQVWIGFAFRSDATVQYSEGTHIDDVLVRKCTGANCPPAGTPVMTPATASRFQWARPGSNARPCAPTVLPGPASCR